MIDKPNGKVEELIEQLYQFCGKVREQAKTTKSQKWIKTTVAVASVIISTFVIVGYVTPETVTFIVDDYIEKVETEYETTSRTVASFIEDHQIDYIDGVDRLEDVELDDRIKDNMEIRVTKAYDIKVKADGKTTKLTTLPITAGEVLAQLGITVGEDDIVEPSPETKLVAGDKVVVKRVTYKVVSKKVTVDYEVVYQEDSSMGIGQMELTQEGKDGRLKKTYKVKYIDGKEVGRKLIKTKTLKKVKNKVYNYGTNISFGDAPPSYQKKISGVRAVSYYFSGNPSGAYGLPCTYGTAAVDPKVIPLGSLIYVEGYGYAIANDVGTSIKGKVVDLYMERYDQCLMWGAHSVNVYIIDEA
ncbi:MAG: G5 domain-containing protein [Firmicutes bacterium]|nr:G5 domain-containing protein [Bacillota bacterium]